MVNHPNRSKASQRANIYSRGVLWIAQNDEPTIMLAADMAGMISVLLLADLLGMNGDEIAKAVIRCRMRLAALERQSA